MARGERFNPHMLYAQVQANVKALESCPGPHEFEREDVRHSRCKKCGGVADVLAIIWYNSGLKHGRQENAKPKE